MGEEPAHEPDPSAGNVDRVVRRLGSRRSLPPMGTDPLLALGPPSAIAEEGREAREPVADIVLAPSRIHVTLELPGASRETLEVTATDIRLKIHALGPNGLVYRSDLELPAPVEPEAVGVTYHNSVLDVTLPRRRGHRVRLTKRD